MRVGANPNPNPNNTNPNTNTKPNPNQVKGLAKKGKKGKKGKKQGGVHGMSVAVAIARLGSGGMAELTSTLQVRARVRPGP